MTRELATLLSEHGVQPSAQRAAVARYVLVTDEHPTADRVFSVVRESFPWISRATVYNTLNLFVEKGLLRQLAVTQGSIVYDPNTAQHHHFIDEKTGAIHDIPWESVEVCNVQSLDGFDVTDYQVVMRGTKRRGRRA